MIIITPTRKRLLLNGDRDHGPRKDLEVRQDIRHLKPRTRMTQNPEIENVIETVIHAMTALIAISIVLGQRQVMTLGRVIMTVMSGTRETAIKIVEKKSTLADAKRIITATIDPPHAITVLNINSYQFQYVVLQSYGHRKWSTL